MIRVMQRLSAIALITALALVGCAPATPDTVADQTATTERPLTVSVATTCDLLFGGTLATDAIDLVVSYAAEPTSVTPEQISPIIRALEAASESANREIAPFIDAQIAPLETMRARLAGENPPDRVEFDQFKAAGLETTNLCDSL